MHKVLLAAAAMLVGSSSAVYSGSESSIATDVRHGQLLFESALLSSDRQTSCKSCHSQERGFADTVSKSRGVHGRRGNRNAPGIWGVRFQTSFGWDGGSQSLVEVIEKAFQNENEMDADVDAITTLLRTLGYQEGGTESPTRKASALISKYLEALPHGRAPIDAYLLEGDDWSLSPSQKEGMKVFFGKAHCSVCHAVSHAISHPFGGTFLNFTDQRFHNLGLVAAPAGNGPSKKLRQDLGRETVTGLAADRGHFRTPTLRNIGLTAPYMHDGRLNTLEQVVNFYNAGGGGEGKDPILKPLFLTEAEKTSLVEFMDALTECGADSENISVRCSQNRR